MSEQFYVMLNCLLVLIVSCIAMLFSSTVHEITIEVTGPAVDADHFSVRTVRCSPTAPGLVTSTATQDSFFSSMTSKLLLHN